jgi:two-component system CheB/CheR fusion protein
VLVTHLAPGHASALPEIVGRYTKMPVASASDGAEIEPDHVYICPPDRVMTIEQGRLRLHQRATESHRKPIDVFLTSLARDLGQRAIGIVLSGSGTDGTLGLKAIKEQGGLTLAQGSDGSRPGQSGMPDTAIAANVVDLVISVEDMAGQLSEFAREFDGEPLEAIDSDDAPAALEAIYRILLNQVGHDFSGYKENTFLRRVRRRMQVQRVERLEEYVARLRESPEEVTLLFRDLLIGVTNFFRDTDAFEALAKLVIPRLFEGRGASDFVRIWVPGCATGEEVYSLAILVREHMDTLRASPKVQLFATDIDEQALTVARIGRYPAALLDGVSAHRLRRFFSGDELSMAVNKEIRDLCIFSAHSVIRDPPFSRVDLISCRNLLIYLGIDFQSRVIPVFHFALRPRGFLFLGTSENVSQHGDLFAPLEKKHRIFERRDHAAGPLDLALPGRLGRPGRPVHSGAETPRHGGGLAISLQQAVERRVRERFMPPHVVVNREGEILYYSPRTGKYLEAPAGLPDRQLLAMARHGLRLDLRAALREANETRRTITRRQIGVDIDDRVQLIDLTIDPLGDHDTDPLFVVVFNDVGPPSARSDLRDGASAADDSNVENLEHELRDTRERLQATIEEYETAVEELKSSNEELQSMNEELQSTNEELETSKEELQSVNEELHTVNGELNSKVEEVDRAHSDLRNLFESTQIATVFLDEDLIIRAFTPAVIGIFNLISSDRGRPLSDIVSNLDDSGDLKRDIRTVFEHGQPIERRVRSSVGATHYLMRILPYRVARDAIEGVLVTFVNVTRLVESEAHQYTLVEELNHRVRNMLAVISAVATQTLAHSASPEAFEKAFLGRIDSMAKTYGLVSNEQWGDISLEAILQTELRAYADEDEKDRIVIEGPSLAFKPAQAIALGLVFHELATNAAKYGALSTGDGRLAVTWSTQENRLVLQWRESNGPKVRAPKRRGFGTELIERQLKAVLDGEVSLDYASGGFALDVSIPFEGDKPLAAT